MNWGNKILVVFVAFGSMISYMVYRCVKTPVNLVSEQYYKDELAYQNVIDGTKRANALSGKLELAQEDNGISQQEYQSECSEKREILLPPERWISLANPRQIPVKNYDSQIVREVLRCQHEAETRAYSRVPLPTALQIDFACRFRSVIEVKCEPGEENQQGVFFGKPIHNDGKCSGGPEEGGK